jgi:hypothetical protein
MNKKVGAINSRIDLVVKSQTEMAQALNSSRTEVNNKQQEMTNKQQEMAETLKSI